MSERPEEVKKDRSTVEGGIGFKGIYEGGAKPTSEKPPEPAKDDKK